MNWYSSISKRRGYMTPPVLDKTEKGEKGERIEEVGFSEKSLVVVLHAVGHSWVRVTREGGRAMFYFPRGETEEVVRKWMANEAIPIDDTRKIFASLVRFNVMVRDEYR
jgi:hypothetical protein